MRSLVCAVVVLAACEGPPHGGRDAGASDARDASDAALPSDAAAPSDAVDGDGAACDTEVSSYPLAAGTHVAECSAVTWDSNPPTSGAHYPTWAAYGTYDQPVPLGFLVHDLEHGAVIILYNCPEGCDAELADLQDYLDARPTDPTCTAPVARRIIVSPDPDLDVRFAAAAWGWALRSSCFDLAALDGFIDDHYAKAPENLCGDGRPSPSCP